MIHSFSFGGRRVLAGVLGALSLGASACALVPPEQASPSLPPGLVLASQERLYEQAVLSRFERGGDTPLVAHVVRLDLDPETLRLDTTSADESGGGEFVARLTSAELARTGAQLAVNASYFLPFRGGRKGGEDYYPHVGDAVWASGAVIADGRPASPAETALDVRVNAILCMRDARLQILPGQVCPKWATDAVAAGPLLLENGRRADVSAHDPDYAASLAPRTALGLSRDRRTAWIVVVDGRQPGYSLGVGLAELADLFFALGAVDALNLDGGGSSTLVRQGEDGRPEIVGRPIHTNVPGRERPVANHLVVFIGTPKQGPRP